MHLTFDAMVYQNQRCRRSEVESIRIFVIPLEILTPGPAEQPLPFPGDVWPSSAVTPLLFWSPLPGGYNQRNA